MTDGWDDRSAYGYNWLSKGSPGEGSAAGQLRLSARNSGLFFVQATEEVLRMMGRLQGRMEREAVWDQVRT